MVRAVVATLLVFTCLISSLAITAASRSASLGFEDSKTDASYELSKKKKKKEFTSPKGLFIQERASKQLPGPGQHFNFGALQPWEDILNTQLNHTSRKLLLVVRHGQAVSNWLEDALGPDEWYNVEQTCSYEAKDGKTWGIFDAELTELGQEQAKSLNALLKEAGWFDKFTRGRPSRAVVSPLSRCLTTAGLILDGAKLNATRVEEYVRETLGEDTCDARRSVSDPDHAEASGPCNFKQGLASKFPQYKFPVYDKHKDKLGLISDDDILWKPKDREVQSHQVRRARKFLRALFDSSPERVVFVVTHSGFTRSALLAVGREPYRPQNAELVPVIVERRERGKHGEEEFEEDEEDDDMVV